MKSIFRRPGSGFSMSDLQRYCLAYCEDHVAILMLGRHDETRILIITIQSPIQRGHGQESLGRKECNEAKIAASKSNTPEL